MDTQHNATQPLTQHDGSSDGEDGDFVDQSSWGRLVSATMSGTHDLCSRDQTIGDGDLDVHTIGRNHKCDVVVDDHHVSGYHCRVFRRWEHLPSLSTKVVRVYLEDTSSNGTFLNNSRLRKREQRELLNGDEVALLSPKKDALRRTAFSFIKLGGKNTRNTQCYPCVHGISRSLTAAASDAARRIEVDYDIREELGRGAIGKVYRAIERNSGIPWAIKVVPVSRSSQQSMTYDAILHEARVLRELCHPAIVAVRDVYCNEMACYIVMQLVEGGDLFDRILRRRVYTEIDARGVVEILLSALGYLHERKIAHRDIKPENILMRSATSDVDILLTDFGLAKVSEAGSNRYTTICGTPQYLAPEVVSQAVGSDDSGYDGAAADIWSVGVVLLVLLSGTQPYHADWLFNAMWPKLSCEARDIIRLMTIIDASLRPTAFSLAHAPWFEMKVNEGELEGNS